MKVEKAKQFSPIIITIESQTELDWLHALSNSSVNEAKAAAEALGFKIQGDAEAINRAQMSFYSAMEGAANS